MNEDFWKTVEKYFGDMLDHFTRIDDLLRETNKKLDKLYEAILRLQLVKPPPEGVELPPVVVRFPINTAYDVLEFDLTTARTDEPVGLRKRGITVYGLTVLRCDDEASIKLNSKAMPSIPCSVGMQITDFKINEIFVTNPASSTSGAKLVLYIEWR